MKSEESSVGSSNVPASIPSSSTLAGSSSTLPPGSAPPTSPQSMFNRLMQLKELYKRSQAELDLSLHDDEYHARKFAGNFGDRFVGVSGPGLPNKKRSGASGRGRVDADTGDLLNHICQVLDEHGGTAHVETVIDYIRVRFPDLRRARDGMPLDPRKAVLGILNPKTDTYTFNSRPLFVKDLDSDSVWSLAARDPIDSDLEGEEDDDMPLSAHYAQQLAGVSAPGSYPSSSHSANSAPDEEGFRPERYAYYCDDDDRPENLSTLMFQAISSYGGRSHCEDISQYCARNWTRPSRFESYTDEDVKERVRVTLHTDPRFCEHPTMAEYYIVQPGTYYPQGGANGSGSGSDTGTSRTREVKRRAISAPSGGAGAGGKAFSAPSGGGGGVGGAAASTAKATLRNKRQEPSPAASLALLSSSAATMHAQSQPQSSSRRTPVPVVEETVSSRRSTSRRAATPNPPSMAPVPSPSLGPPPGYRCSCGAMDPGRQPNARWRRGPRNEWLCNPCMTALAKKHACPVCGKVYRKNDPSEEENPWIRCDDCHRWVMSKCDGINDLSLYDDDNPNHLHYSCPVCREDKEIARRIKLEEEAAAAEDPHPHDQQEEEIVSAASLAGSLRSRRAAGKSRRGLVEDLINSSAVEMMNVDSAPESPANPSTLLGVPATIQSPSGTAPLATSTSPTPVAEPMESAPQSSAANTAAVPKKANGRKATKRKRTGGRAKRRTPRGGRGGADEGEAEGDAEGDEDEGEGDGAGAEAVSGTSGSEQLDAVEREIVEEWRDNIRKNYPQASDNMLQLVESKISQFKQRLLLLRDTQVRPHTEELNSQLAQFEQERASSIKGRDDALAAQLRAFYQQTKGSLDTDRRRAWAGEDIAV
eukprot:TRINITY_DN3151_c0_g1_i2.p1 TRINITY_DN3151_c0_g1~~TRINITY_DN3151_c0_g1_i2.p1  ORF type:complete len:872 (-),score=212.46 TRINITY_DN3151_c0_g1_i2:65-2680(-)